MRQTPKVRRPRPEPKLLLQTPRHGGPIRSEGFSLSTDHAAATTEPI